MRISKTVENGHEVRRNNASLYIDGRMEYQAVNLVTEYGQKLNGCKYAVASEHSQMKMEELYKEELKKFEPYIYLTTDEYGAIYKYQKNDNKHYLTEVRKHHGFCFAEELTEIMHECEKPDQDEEPTALDRMVEAVDDEVFERKRVLMKAAMEQLTETQRRRIVMSVCEEKSYREIADAENASLSSVQVSIESAKKKIKKYFQKNS